MDISVSKIFNSNLLSKESAIIQNQCDMSSNFYLQYVCEIPVANQEHRDFV